MEIEKFVFKLGEIEQFWILLCFRMLVKLNKNI